jgi:hypothetical protein
MILNTELLFLTTGIVSFLTALVGLTALLSIARQVRTRLPRRAVSTGVEPIVEDVTLPHWSVDETKPTVSPETGMEKLRLAVQANATAPVTLAIEPENGPTRQQRTVQRLIEYLKEESTKTPAPVSPV